MEKAQEIIAYLPTSYKKIFEARFSKKKNKTARLAMAIQKWPFETDKMKFWRGIGEKGSLNEGNLARIYTKLKDELYKMIVEPLEDPMSLPGLARLLEFCTQISAKKNMEGLWTTAQRAMDLPGKGETELEACYALFVTRYRFEEYRRDRFKRRPSSILNLLAVIDQLTDETFLFKKLRWYCVNTSPNLRPPTLLNDTSLGNRVDECGNAFLRAYYFLALLKTTPKDYAENRRQLLLLLSDPFFKRKDETVEELYHLSLNRFIKQRFEGDEEVVTDIFNLYRSAIEFEIFNDQNGEIDARHFINMPEVAREVGELEYAKEFVEKYQDRIKGPQKENALIWQKIKELFWKKDFRAAQKLLKESWPKYEDAWQFKGRRMSLKLHWALGEEDEFELLLDSFRVYLNRERNRTEDRVHPVRFRREKHFLELTKKIFLFSDPDEPKEKNAEFVAAINEPGVEDRPWLLQFLSERWRR